MLIWYARKPKGFLNHPYHLTYKEGGHLPLITSFCRLCAFFSFSSLMHHTYKKNKKRNLFTLG